MPNNTNPNKGLYQALGLLSISGGISEVTLSAVAFIPTWGASSITMAHGIDNIITGSKMAYHGKYAESTSIKLLKSTMSDTAAHITDAAISLSPIALTVPLRLTSLYKAVGTARPKFFGNTIADMSKQAPLVSASTLRQTVAPEKFIYAVSSDGKLFFAKPNFGPSSVLNAQGKPMYTIRNTHAEILNGAPLIGAGEAVFKNGMPISINSLSGHYLPFGTDKAVLHAFSKAGFKVSPNVFQTLSDDMLLSVSFGKSANVIPDPVIKKLLPDIYTISGIELAQAPLLFAHKQTSDEDKLKIKEELTKEYKKQYSENIKKAQDPNIRINTAEYTQLLNDIYSTGNAFGNFISHFDTKAGKTINALTSATIGLLSLATVTMPPVAMVGSIFGVLGNLAALFGQEPNNPNEELFKSFGEYIQKEFNNLYSQLAGYSKHQLKAIESLYTELQLSSMKSLIQGENIYYNLRALILENSRINKIHISISHKIINDIENFAKETQDKYLSDTMGRFVKLAKRKINNEPELAKYVADITEIITDGELGATSYAATKLTKSFSPWFKVNDLQTRLSEQYPDKFKLINPQPNLILILPLAQRLIEIYNERSRISKIYLPTYLNLKEILHELEKVKEFEASLRNPELINQIFNDFSKGLKKLSEVISKKIESENARIKDQRRVNVEKFVADYYKSTDLDNYLAQETHISADYGYANHDEIVGKIYKINKIDTVDGDEGNTLKIFDDKKDQSRWFGSTGIEFEYHVKASKQKKGTRYLDETIKGKIFKHHQGEKEGYWFSQHNEIKSLKINQIIKWRANSFTGKNLPAPLVFPIKDNYSILPSFEFPLDLLDKNYQQAILNGLVKVKLTYETVDIDGKSKIIIYVNIISNLLENSKPQPIYKTEINYDREFYDDNEFIARLFIGGKYADDALGTIELKSFDGEKGRDYIHLPILHDHKGLIDSGMPSDAVTTHVASKESQDLIKNLNTDYEKETNAEISSELRHIFHMEEYQNLFTYINNISELLYGVLNFGYHPLTQGNSSYAQLFFHSGKFISSIKQLEETIKLGTINSPKDLISKFNETLSELSNIQQQVEIINQLGAIYNSSSNIPPLNYAIQVLRQRLFYYSTNIKTEEHSNHYDSFIPPHLAIKYPKQIEQCEKKANAAFTPCFEKSIAIELGSEFKDFSNTEKKFSAEAFSSSHVVTSAVAWYLVGKFTVQAVKFGVDVTKCVFNELFGASIYGECEDEEAKSLLEKTKVIIDEVKKTIPQLETCRNLRPSYLILAKEEFDDCLREYNKLIKRRKPDLSEITDINEKLDTLNIDFKEAITGLTKCLYRSDVRLVTATSANPFFRPSSQHFRNINLSLPAAAGTPKLT